MTTTPADLFAQALTFDVDGVVRTVNVPLARQAIDLHLSIGGDLRTLLQPYWWFYYPRCVLSLAFDGDDLDRECRLHAVLCVRSVLHLALPEDRPMLDNALEVAERYAHGGATAQEMKAARAVADAAVAKAKARTAAGAARTAARATVYATSDTVIGAADASRAAGIAVADAQQGRLIAVVCAALQ